MAPDSGHWVASIVRSAGSLHRWRSGVDRPPGPVIAWPANEAYFTALPVLELARGMRLHPRQIAAATWLLRCPVCLTEAARLVVFPSLSLRLSCGLGCPPWQMWDLIEAAA